MATDQTDYVVKEGVDSDGFGTVPKMVMRDERLSIGAKAVYAYFCSYAGAGKSAFPQRKRVLKELGISYNSFRKYRTELEECGYITVQARVRSNGSTASNLYVLNAEVVRGGEIEASSEAPDNLSNFDTPKGAENTITPGGTRVSNFEPLPNFDRVSNFEQGGVSNFDKGGVSNFGYPTTSNNSINNNNTNKLTNQPSSCNEYIDLRDAQPSTDGRLDGVFEELCCLSPNKHLLSEAKPYFYALVEEGYAPKEILRAWRSTLSDKENFDLRYQPQLKAWLKGTRDDNARNRINKTRALHKPSKTTESTSEDELKAKAIERLRAEEPLFNEAYCQLTSHRAALMAAIVRRSKYGETENALVEEINQKIKPLQEYCDQWVNQVLA